MCRLLAVVSSEATDFRFGLRDAPRSLAALSPQHPDGWGIAVHGHHGWELHKHAACAHTDSRFDDLAATARGVLLVAHVRKRTVGPIGIANTHPFLRGSWVFAHNGTIEDLAYLEARTSPERRAEIVGQTDSELLLAWLLTVIDAAGPTTEARDRALAVAMYEATASPKLGAANFLLCDGTTMWAHRFGRTLFWLERGTGDRVVPSRRSEETQAIVDTPWSARRRALLIASEAMTHEPWNELPERSLVRVEGGSEPSLTFLLGGEGVHSVR